MSFSLSMIRNCKMAQAVEYFKCKEGRICPPSEKYIHFDLDLQVWMMMHQLCY